MKDENRPYKIADLTQAVKDLGFAEATLNEKRMSLKRMRDSIKSHEVDEIEQEANVKRHEAMVKKIAANLEK